MSNLYLLFLRNTKAPPTNQGPSSVTPLRPPATFPLQVAAPAPQRGKRQADDDIAGLVELVATLQAVKCERGGDLEHHLVPRGRLLRGGGPRLRHWLHP
jgi:hypothetical protein